VKLTLSQAQERVAAFPGLAIDWTRPAEEACRMALVAGAWRLKRAEVEAIHEALMAYAAHLAFQEGRDFELDAIKGRLMVAAHEASKQCCEDVLANELTAICNGLHHAESAQRGDVRRDGKAVPDEA
jgi:uncharacterized membrane protein